MPNLQGLNARKKEILDAQEKMLNSATEAKRQLAADEETQFSNLTSELDSINVNITRTEMINKGKLEVGSPSSKLAVPEFSNSKSKSEEYAKNFWNALSTHGRDARECNFRMAAALSEGGTAADGSFLVPNQTSSAIPNLAVIEASARKLSKVISTEMDVKLPYQASKTVAAAKAESKDTGTTAFATNVPTFATTTLTAYMAGDSIPVSWELLQDVKALSEFLPAELQRAIFNYEEAMFISGTGTNQPLGYLNGATAASTAALSINAILDLESALKAAYYEGASFLINRGEFNRLRKAQLAANQFQSYITNVGKDFFLDGYPVAFSTLMPSYVASPSTTGAVLFGNFNAGWTIGDRGGSDIHIKVLDQVAALNGQTIILGYRRTDQKCTLQESVQMLTTNG